ncbi:hypothetical protein LTR56_007435 [Elasticomyces elasticus]|nr:hypothetical protein LTR56_007435 [Elasticomyces elasticus]KAK3668025.1 hypothetical protein LTR22_001093 [Elasticomyces elasticus]KAK4925173.1 hypothetical protein LTR49_007711 [Elasticomyces elasticus]KAK5767665.1 hypothetical protein LTS12_002167 [Elasticomyces elasticus]
MCDIPCGSQANQVLVINRLLHHDQEEEDLDPTESSFLGSLNLAQLVRNSRTKLEEYAICCCGYTGSGIGDELQDRCKQRKDKNILHAYTYRFLVIVKDPKFDLKHEFGRMAAVFFCHRHRNDRNKKRFVDHCIAQAVAYRRTRGIVTQVESAEGSAPSSTQPPQAQAEGTNGAETSMQPSVEDKSAVKVDDTKQSAQGPGVLVLNEATLMTAVQAVFQLEGKTCAGGLECLLEAVNIAWKIIDDYGTIIDYDYSCGLEDVEGKIKSMLDGAQTQLDNDDMFKLWDFYEWAYQVRNGLPDGTPYPKPHA